MYGIYNGSCYAPRHCKYPYRSLARILTSIYSIFIFLNLIDNFLNELVHVTGNELAEYVRNSSIAMTVN
jgi:hypothetical protein